MAVAIPDFRGRVRPVKRLVLWLIAILSVLYLLVMGPMIDPLPFLDEATALAVLAFAMRSLGYDVARWIPFLRHLRGQAPAPRNGPPPPPGGGRGQRKTAERPDEVIDV